MFKRISFLLLGVGAVGGIGGFLLFFWLVVFAPGEEIRQSNIEKILAVESPVMYSGGKEKIGVFFETAHRQYIPFDLIPRDFINGIVASEDRKFFQHHGFDLFGVLRAMAANVRAGRVVQGGSTITQQTAKNLFKRKDRSLVSKVKELLYALRLEYHYPKEKILEFYANQFYVSGNGRGLGVAARYYFNKDVSELDLLECTFIAGSVKRPNYYNPFIKRDEEAKRVARERSRQRVKYVLGQMYRNETLDAAIYDEYLGKEVPFEQGKMYFSLNTIMDLVKEALDEPEITEAFREHGIDNVATSGVKIVTSVEKNLQDESFFLLRKELSRLDVRLRGYEREEVQNEYFELTRDNRGVLEPKSFHFGRISRIDDGVEPKVWVSITGSREGDPEGVIDRKGLTNLLNPLVKYERQLWSEPGKKDLPDLLGRLHVGDIVYTSVRKVDSDTGDYHLDLEKYPVIQGAVLAMREGMIRAMVGGNENRYYNRAISARRPMGSVVKPLVYCAALQLGWNSMDVLNNERDVFVYQKMPYFPRPDHKSPYKGVSMSWAGVHSENVATVWLLYHLCDHLTPAQFRQILARLGLDQMKDETLSSYRKRIRDTYGVVVDDNALNEIAFERAVADLEPDLIFAGRMSEYETITKFHFGTDYDTFLEKVDYDLGLVEEDELEMISEEELAEEPDEIKEIVKDKDYKKREKEAELRKAILQRNYLRFKKIWDEMNELRVFANAMVEGPDETALYQDRITGSYIFIGNPEVPEEEEIPLDQLEADETPGELLGDPTVDIVLPDEAAVQAEPVVVPEEWEMVGRADLIMMLSSMDVEQEKEFWDGVLVDNLLAAGTMDLLSNAIDREYEKLRGLPTYGPEVLHQVRDFKVMVAIQYIIGLCRAIGIESKLDPVLSFPLGSNVLNLLEVARAYEGMLTGSIRLNSADGGEGLSIIESIEGSDGEVIYQPQQVDKPVVAPEVSIAVNDILRRVVKFGTGRGANRNVRLRSPDPKVDRQLVDLGIRVPVVGKTGTANRFTNASFAGGIPGVGQSGFFSMSDGYVLTTYVGFDDNVPMVRNTTHITGAAGALPLWSSVTNRILLENDYGSKLDLVDMSFSGITEFPMAYPDLGQVEVKIDPERGGVPNSDPDASISIISFGESLGGGRIKPARFFKPYWLMEEN